MNYESDETAPTYWARIYMSGPIEAAKQALRAECLREGLCVTIEPTLFIYTGGEEVGFVVGLANYPRFPKTAQSILERAQRVVSVLLAATHQHSAMLMTPESTRWVSLRHNDSLSGPNAGRREGRDGGES
jgi:hypothetical protein